MNLSIQDGRAELWQWDTGIRLVMDEACEAVNISASTFGVTVDVTAAEDGKTWVAAVPDEMLQKPGDLICYAVQSTATGTITAAYRSFRVNRRPKPAGYVATPTEARTWQELNEMLAKKIDAPQKTTKECGESETITLADNAEYRLTNVTALTFAYPENDFECWIRLTIAESGDVAVVLPEGTKYIGSAPTFANDEMWELSIKDGVVIAQKVGDGT